MGFGIEVRTLTGETLQVDGLRDSNDVNTVHVRIFESTGVPIECQRLIYAGKQIENKLLKRLLILDYMRKQLVTKSDLRGLVYFVNYFVS